MNQKINPELEEIEIARIIKKNGGIEIIYTGDTQKFELYGFLKCYLQALELDLIDSFEPTDNDEAE